MLAKQQEKLALSFVLWLALVSAGFYLLFRYENTPASFPKQDVPAQWPVSSGLEPAATPYTLVMAVHPHCPCTRASMEELAGVLAHGKEKLNGFALFFRPKGFEESWMQTDVYRYISSLPGITSVTDADGSIARSFGLSASGHVLIYDREGDLLFSGGITAARGHMGANRGANAIKQLLHSGMISTEKTPVFGCSLSGKGESWNQR